jgi:glycosyltransferase involved in cell wall biosynthesis
VTSISISVAIVCRNALAGLQRTLESIQAMEDPRLHCVIIDGGSSDGTGSWLRNADLGMSMSYLSEPDSGIYDAMNKAWLASPPHAFVLFLGAGDLLISVPDDEQLRDAQGSPLPLVIGRVDIGDVPFRSKWGGMMRLRNTAHHQGLLIHRAIHPAAPFDAGLKVYGDWDFNLRLLRIGVKAVHRPNLHAFAEPGGLSWIPNLTEIRLVAARNGGWLIGFASWALNWYSLQRRRNQTMRSFGSGR